jgi:hypothetical protein
MPDFSTSRWPSFSGQPQFQQNLKVLETNGRGYEVARSSPPREGAALLQGRAICAAVELAWEIRREIEARHDEADQLRLRAIERAQFDADLAQRRFMLVDPNNRLVADTLEQEWNDKLRALAVSVAPRPC